MKLKISDSQKKVDKMAALKVIFALFIIYSVAKAAPSENDLLDQCELAELCKERSETEYLDEFICASNDYEMRYFSGHCRMHKFNCDEGERKLKIL